MTERAATFARPGKSLGRALIHLRLAFSLVLAPLFFWGVYLANLPRLPWLHLLLAFLIIHIPLYGGMNAFNSYYDRDEGPIGSLLEPPPVDHTVLVVALLCKALALLGGLLLDVRFGLLVAAGILFSVLYSHPLARWKERPLLAGVFVFVGQGVLGVLWGWTAATWQGEAANLAAIWPGSALGVVGLLSAATWTLGFYPLTGVYQIQDDGQRNMRTLAVALGVDGSFLFAAAVASLGGVGVWAVLFGRGEGLAMALSALYLVYVALYIWRWYNRFTALSVRENQQTLMRLAYTNGSVFGVLFLALALLGG